MAGHSKWANIRHKKERKDAKRGKVFSRIAKEIISAVKQGGPDPKGNTKLRFAIQKAKAVNMPSDNIERNIKKASSKDQASFSEMLYEIYGYEGVGILIDAMTDNKNRTASDMRIAINKRGGSLAAMGAVSYNFDKKGCIECTPFSPHDEFELFLMECNVEDYTIGEDVCNVIVDTEKLIDTVTLFESKGITINDSSFGYVPKATIAVSEEGSEKNKALIEWLEDIDDVDCVYHSLEGY